MEKEKIVEILNNHKIWLDDNDKGTRANLQKADLQEADLRGADLRGADLQKADLQEADLRGAGLCGADLRGADLQKADLQEADLWGANLQKAYLREADLRGADLQEADLRGADLRGADLQKAYLREANLRGAYLQKADLQEAYLPYYKICPEEGDFIGWKKAGAIIIKLLITSKRTSSLVGRKCRTDRAKVLEFQNIYGDLMNIPDVQSDYDPSFIYKIGEELCEPEYSVDIRVECDKGIHFFITREEAVDY